MTRDDIIRLAKEAGLSNEIGAFGYPYLPELERFAARVAAEKDREIKRLREALHRISLASQNSMSSKDECGRIARAALQEQPK